MASSVVVILNKTLSRCRFPRCVFSAGHWWIPGAFRRRNDVHARNCSGSSHHHLHNNNNNNKTYSSQKKLLSACIVVVVIVLLIAGFHHPPIVLSSLILFQSSSTPLNRISESSRKLIELGRVERAILALAGAAPDATRSPSVGVWAIVKQHFSRRTLRHKKNQQHDEDGADMVWGTTFEYAVKSVFMRREDVFLLPVNSTSPLDELPRGFTLNNSMILT